MDSWNTRFLLGFGLFSGANFELLVSGKVCHGMSLGGKDAHLTQPMDPEKKSLNFIFPTKYVPMDPSTS